jgi:hypothetical protein
MKLNLWEQSAPNIYALDKGAVQVYLVFLLALLTSSLCFSQTFPPLPEGNTGIASHYPNDAGIAADASVIFADDFESYADSSGLTAKWNGGVYHNVRIATEPGHVFAGAKAVEFCLPQQTIEWSNTVARDLDKAHELTLLFLRAYTKFDTTFDVVGSSHNGIGMSAHYFINDQATPGMPSDGYNKFLMEFESWRGTAADTSPGSLNVYIYHPGQRSQWGDHFFPDGEVMPNTSIPYDFGSGFVSRPWITCKLGKWYCVELMVKDNTVGQSDGRVACWLDGKLIADFQNLTLRYADSLKINRFNLSLHAGSNPTRQTYKWYDNVVAATSYIGPTVTTGIKQGLMNDKSDEIHQLMICGMTLSFSLEKKSAVGVAIYSMQGRIIRDLSEHVFEAGSHRVTWDGKDGTGKQAAKGIYVVRMTVQGKEMSGIMVVER